MLKIVHGVIVSNMLTFEIDMLRHSRYAMFKIVHDVIVRAYITD